MSGATTACVEGVRYRAAPEDAAGTCYRCVGYENRALCLSLPDGCSTDGVIWVAATHTPTEALQCSHVYPTWRYECPSKAYKPTHGGYPDAPPAKGVTG